MVSIFWPQDTALQTGLQNKQLLLEKMNLTADRKHCIGWMRERGMPHNWN